MKTRSILCGLLALLSAAFLGGCGAQHVDEEEAPTEVAVQVGKVTRVTLRARVDAYGTIEGEPAGGGKAAGAARLSTSVAGVVMAVPAQEGERVDAGAVVVKLDDQAALAQVRLAEQQMARQKKLLPIGGASEKSVQEAAQQLAAARAQLALVHLASPIAGVVARIHVQPGQTVDPNTVVAEVIDPTRLVATVDVPATEAASLKPGQAAELLAAQDTEPVVTGRVSFLSPQVDPKTNTMLVRISVPAEAGLRPGQFVHVRITTEERANTLAVPREAVYTDHDGRSTLSIVEGDVARQKPVQTGLRDGHMIEVAGDGVIEGATVVTLGSYALPAETKIRVIGQ